MITGKHNVLTNAKRFLPDGINRVKKQCNKKRKTDLFIGLLLFLLFLFLFSTFLEYACICSCVDSCICFLIRGLVFLFLLFLFFCLDLACVHNLLSSHVCGLVFLLFLLLVLRFLLLHFDLLCFGFLLLLVCVCLRLSLDGNICRSLVLNNLGLILVLVKLCTLLCAS